MVAAPMAAHAGPVRRAGADARRRRLMRRSRGSGPASL